MGVCRAIELMDKQDIPELGTWNTLRAAHQPRRAGTYAQGLDGSRAHSGLLRDAGSSVDPGWLHCLPCQGLFADCCIIDKRVVDKE